MNQKEQKVVHSDIKAIQYERCSKEFTRLF
jgi:hypothetical protein